ncbi:hypothetical protein [Scytonema sp. HK-05]|uniref:hypothetical protein n=1 Tax=Scytonema sp. HK-05 TaxID=1137095 RepID=UPI0013019C16|nr:hypothetical protein [Scytonema sp. HK-05]
MSRENFDSTVASDFHRQTKNHCNPQLTIKSPQWVQQLEASAEPLSFAQYYRCEHL